MNSVPSICFRIVVSLLVIGLPRTCPAQDIAIHNDHVGKRLVFGNARLRFTLDYNGKASIPALTVNGQEVLDSISGICSRIRTAGATWSTKVLSADPTPKIAGNTVALTDIRYGDKSHSISETWTFTITPDSIRWNIRRTLSNPVQVEHASLPVFVFRRLDTWEGAYQSYGGLAWFYLFNKPLDTYGVHSQASRFWNSKTDNGLNIVVDAPGQQVAMSYSRTKDDRLAYDISVGRNEFTPRFDSGTWRRRYLSDTTDVWAPYIADTATTSQTITLSAFDFDEQYGRGKFVGINGRDVGSVLNTIARIGVIDKQHFGANSWHTPYGPICLHEQYIAQLGLGIDDPEYLEGYQQCLDYYRDNAIRFDGRVWPRWAYTNEDAMSGKFTDKGFYEARWGYLLDANPDLVTNVAELYDLTGDSAWVRTHQRSCEKALDWICNRDTNHNGLVEMMTDSYTQKKSSDWIDIIWASYENAFVNAKLYHALVLWAAIERQLGNPAKAGKYDRFSKMLKVSFNKPVAEGGFWDEKDSCYIHWREKDGSIHGTNMVTPVNFMAIDYGICADPKRKKAILDKIERQMQKEKLFFWPICLYSYQPGEGNDWQFPFPKYENGDLFLSWGALGVEAYASYKPEIALRYVANVLAQYEKDGLAFQRYGRRKQDGLGDDILAGNSLSVVGLYQSIFGINPLYNRFYLNPHLPAEMDGTRLKYNFRDQRLLIDLSRDSYAVSNGRFAIHASKDFGFYCSDKELRYFDGASPRVSLGILTQTKANLTVNIQVWGRDRMRWRQSSDKSQKWAYRVNQLKPGASYTFTVNGATRKKLKAGADASIAFECATPKDAELSLEMSGNP